MYLETDLVLNVLSDRSSPSSTSNTIRSSHSAPTPTLRECITPFVGTPPDTSSTTTVSVEWRKHGNLNCGLRYNPNHIPSYVRVSGIPEDEIPIAPSLYPFPTGIDNEERRDDEEEEEEEEEELETEKEREPLEYGELTIKGLTLSPILSRLPERRDLPSIRSIFPDIFQPHQPYNRRAQMARYLEGFERQHRSEVASHRTHAAHQS